MGLLYAQTQFSSKPLDRDFQPVCQKRCAGVKWEFRAQRLKICEKLFGSVFRASTVVELMEEERQTILL